MESRWKKVPSRSGQQLQIHRSRARWRKRVRDQELRAVGQKVGLLHDAAGDVADHAGVAEPVAEEVVMLPAKSLSASTSPPGPRHCSLPLLFFTRCPSPL